MQNFFKELASGVFAEQNALMSEYTTFKTGGRADFLVKPQTESEIAFVVSLCKNHGVPFCVIGRGSNLLVSEGGVRGVVIRIADGFDKISISGQTITAQAGASLRSVFAKATEYGLVGLAFAAGIPGCVGGGVVMNAGAYGGELKDVVSSVRVLNADGTITELSNKQMCFSYRCSALSGKDSVVLSADFSLPQGDTEESLRLANEYSVLRREKQPLSFACAGSTFKRPVGNFAGTLIEQCGLKGCTIGGAQVSEKHAGFIINLGSATSTDIHRLICRVQDEVHKQTGVALEPEVKLLGEFEGADNENHI